MTKVMLVLRKELREIFQTRALVYSLCALPLALLFIAGFALYKANSASGGTGAGSSLGTGADPESLIVIGNLFRLYVLAEPIIIPAMIAAYSIVSEKNNRTLEPVLATPIETWQLLLAKGLSAIIPAIFATWISGGIFVAEMAAFTPPGVFAQVITPGWLILMLLTAPMLTLTPVALTVMTSSRFNDPRVAAQVSSLIFIAMVLVFSSIGRSLVISPPLSLVIAAFLAILGIVLLRLAATVFQRETILTRWK